MNIVHIAWLSEQNYGDELMAEAIYDYLYKKYTDLTIKIWSDKKPIFKGKEQKWIYPFYIKNKFIKKIFEKYTLKKADMLIIGGGSVLHSEYSSKWKKDAVCYFKKKHPKSKAFGIGLSVGPFDKMRDEESCKKFLESLDGCSFRDSISFNYAKSLNLKYEPILAFDLAVLSIKKMMIRPLIENTINTVGVSIRIPYRNDYKKTFDSYVKLLKNLGVNYKKIILFCFSMGDMGSEYKFCKNLVEQTGLDNIDLVEYDGDLKKFTTKIASVNFFISSKLHGVIASFLLNVPCISISYQKKFDDMADDIRLPKEYRFNQSNINVEKIMSLINKYSLPVTGEIYLRAQKNFEVFI